MKQLDGLDWAILAQELQNTLQEARIHRIQQGLDGEFLFTLRKKEDNFKFFIKVKPNACIFSLSSDEITCPKQAPAFCMLLRKHLQGAHILHFQTEQLDRILYLQCAQKDDWGKWKVFTLILEGLGRQSNLILVNDEGRILDAYIRVTQDMSKSRCILPNLLYRLPDLGKKVNLLGLREKKPKELFVETLEEYFKSSSSLNPKDLLSLFYGLSPTLLKEISEQHWIKHDPFAIYEDLSLFWQKLHLLLELKKQAGEKTVPKTLTRSSSTSNNLSPLSNLNYCLPYCVELKGENVHFVFLKNHLDSQLEKKEKRAKVGITSKGSEHPNETNLCFSTLLDAQQYLLHSERYAKLLQQAKKTLMQFLTKEKKQTLKKYKLYLEDYREAQDFEKKRFWGELLLATLSKAQNNKNIQLKAGASSIQVEDLLDKEIDICIPLESHLTLQENAYMYFKKYHKEKKQVKLAFFLMIQSEEYLNYLDQALFYAETYSHIEDYVSLYEEILTVKKREIPSSLLVKIVQDPNFSQLLKQSCGKNVYEKKEKALEVLQSFYQQNFWKFPSLQEKKQKKQEKKLLNKGKSKMHEKKKSSPSFFSSSHLAEYVKASNSQQQGMYLEKLEASSWLEENKTLSHKIHRPEKLGTRRFFSSEGHLIEVGRNNLQNDALLRKYRGKFDLWFHVKGRPGAHVILHAETGPVSEQAKKEAAELCAYFSLSLQARQVFDLQGEATGEQTPVDICPVQEVYRLRHSKPGLVYYENASTLFVQARKP